MRRGPARLGERRPGRVDGRLDVLGRHPVVGHGTHLPVGIFHHLDVARSEGGQERRPVALDAEQHEVRAHARRVERARRRLGRPAGRDDAVHPGQRLGQAAGVGVVLGQPLDHAVRAVGQGDQPGGGEDPGLAHPATDHLAGAARAPDDVASTRRRPSRPGRRAPSTGRT